MSHRSLRALPVALVLVALIGCSPSTPTPTINFTARQTTAAKQTAATTTTKPTAATTTPGRASLVKPATPTTLVAPATAPTPTTTPPAAPPASGRAYPWHTNIISTTFWVGEIFNANLADGSQVCSTYDSQWALHFGGANLGTVPSGSPGCPGSTWGTCDGTWNATHTQCATEIRTATNNYYPTQLTPLENPFYLDLPYDDINDTTGYANRCTTIPWANDPGWAGHCTDQNFSYMKNRWVQITGPNGNTCYGQVQDAGPSHGNLYHDSTYVFGTTNTQPTQGQFNNAGMDVSPALNGCLGFAELDGQNDKVNWRFTDQANVPNGPWTHTITTRQTS